MTRTPTEAPGQLAEVLWDTWGIPHVFARDAPGLFFAFGWAQAHSHADLLLRLYAQGRGRAAETYGESFAAGDRATLTMGLPDRGERWYHEQSAPFATTSTRSPRASTPISTAIPTCAPRRPTRSCRSAGSTCYGTPRE